VKKSDFHFDLPEALIAQAPLPERSASRLLVVPPGQAFLISGWKRSAETKSLKAKAKSNNFLNLLVNFIFFFGKIVIDIVCTYSDKNGMENTS